MPDIYEAQYTLRYDANGGTGTPDQETGIFAQNQYILNVAIRPTHTQVNGANVVFLGWSLVKDGTIYKKTDTLLAGLIIKSVAVQDNTTVYAVWGYDSGAGSGNHTSGRAIAVAASAKGTTNITDDTVPLAEWKPEESRQLETDIRIAYLSGYTDGTVRPDNAITRSEAASIFYRLLKHKGMAAGGRCSDILDNAWYTKEVNYLASLGILTGYPDGTFNPDAHITRGGGCGYSFTL